jgi:DNA helicase-2/ATP-dependent DNA helicase PcrA
LSKWLEGKAGGRLPTDAKLRVERAVRAGLERARDPVSVWADLLTDRESLGSAFERHAPGEFTPGELDRAHKWCAQHSILALMQAEEEAERGERPQRRRGGGDSHTQDRDESHQGVDGYHVDEGAVLDREDDTLLLRLLQRLQGPLKRGQNSKEALVYEHVLVDEAQDLSPVEMAVVMNTVSRGQSVTLAGDVAQRLHMDNGFTGWKPLLSELGLSHVAVEPLKLSYRSTHEILDFAFEVLGPLSPEEPPQATRSGAPVELFPFAHSGEAVAFLSEALRELMQSEPRASVCVISRFPEQADLYYAGLKTGEVPYLRRVADQDFPFRPGVDVTDAKQVKGLEFDYVILVEVSDSAFPADEEARHLLHIAATRAAHQLWIVTSGRPSTLLPEALRSRGY